MLICQDMRYRTLVLVVFASATIAAALAAQGRGGRGTRITPGQECPPGTTETRPGSCQAPEIPPPSIVDYRPRSTLVTAEHLVPKAKFPAIDIHGHPPALTSQEIDQQGRRGDGRPQPARDGERRQLVRRTAHARRCEAINASPHKDRFRVLAGVDFRNVGPGWARAAVRQLEADIKAGAVGVGEISEELRSHHHEA